MLRGPSQRSIEETPSTLCALPPNPSSFSSSRCGTREIRAYKLETLEIPTISQLPTFHVSAPNHPRGEVSSWKRAALVRPNETATTTTTTERADATAVLAQPRNDDDDTGMQPRTIFPLSLASLRWIYIRACAISNPRAGISSLSLSRSLWRQILIPPGCISRARSFGRALSILRTRARVVFVFLRRSLSV